MPNKIHIICTTSQHHHQHHNIIISCNGHFSKSIALRYRCQCNYYSTKTNTHTLIHSLVRTFNFGMCPKIAWRHSSYSCFMQKLRIRKRGNDQQITSIKLMMIRWEWRKNNTERKIKWDFAIPAIEPPPAPPLLSTAIDVYASNRMSELHVQSNEHFMNVLWFVWMIWLVSADLHFPRRTHFR